MIEDRSTDPHGPLANVLAVRSGKGDTRGGGLEHREALIYTLGKAAELEHLIMLQYLFAAFSLKQKVDEGLTPETLAAVDRWRKTLLSIGEQEMLHLALVQNLLTAVGAAPRFARPNFPMPAYSYPAGRPDRAGAVQRGRAAPFRLPRAARGDGRRGRRGVRGDRAGRGVAARRARRDRPAPAGVRHDRPALPLDPGRLRAPGGAARHRTACSSARPAPRRPRSISAGRSSSPVTDLASARRAIDTIVEQGEGARGEWRDAHFGRLLGILDEYLEIKRADPDFEPARPVVAANVRPAGHRRHRAAHHRSRDDPRHGPAQRRLRGPPPAPVALLRPHR